MWLAKTLKFTTTVRVLEIPSPVFRLASKSTLPKHRDNERDLFACASTLGIGAAAPNVMRAIADSPPD
jgi:hypothetical protein